MEHIETVEGSILEWKKMRKRLNQPIPGNMDLHKSLPEESCSEYLEFIDLFEKNYQSQAKNYLIAQYLGNIKVIYDRLVYLYTLEVPNDQKKQQEHLEEIKSGLREWCNYRKTFENQVESFGVSKDDAIIKQFEQCYQKSLKNSIKKLTEIKNKYLILWISKAAEQNTSLLELEAVEQEKRTFVAKDAKKTSPSSSSTKAPDPYIDESLVELGAVDEEEVDSNHDQDVIMKPLSKGQKKKLQKKRRATRQQVEASSPSSGSTEAPESFSDLVEQIRTIAPEKEKDAPVKYTIQEIRNILLSKTKPPKTKSCFEKIKSPQDLLNLPRHPLNFSSIYEGRNHGKGHVNGDVAITTSNLHAHTSETHLICDTSENQYAQNKVAKHKLIQLLRPEEDHEIKVDEVVNFVLHIFDARIVVPSEFEQMREFYRNYIENKTRQFAEKAVKEKSIGIADQLLEFVEEHLLQSDSDSKVKVKVVCTKNRQNKQIFEKELQTYNTLDKLLAARNEGLCIFTSVPELLGRVNGGYYTHNLFHDFILKVSKIATEKSMASTLEEVENFIKGTFKDKYLNVSPSQHSRYMLFRLRDGSVILISGSITFGAASLGKTLNADGDRIGEGNLELEYVIKIKPTPDEFQQIKDDMKSMV